MAFFATDDASGNSRVYAYDISGANPIEKWVFPIPETFSQVWSSPALSADGARLYFGDDNGIIYALDAKNGNLVWSFPNPSSPFGPIRSSPAVSTNLAAGTETVWVTSYDGNLYGVSCSAGALPMLAMESYVGADGGALDRNVQFSSSPIIAADGTVYVASRDATIYAFDPSSPTPLWTVPNPTGQRFLASPAIGPNGTIYVGDMGGNLVAIDPNNHTAPRVVSIGGGLALEDQPVVGRDGTIYVGGNDGNLHAISPSDLSEKTGWPVNCGNPIVASPVLTSDGYAYVVTFSGSGAPLLVVDLSAAQVVNTSDPGTTALWYTASPVVASDGTILVGNADPDNDDIADIFGINPQTPSSNAALGFYAKFRSNYRNSGNVQDNRWTEMPPPVATITDLGTFDNYNNDYSEGNAINDLDYSTGLSQDVRISSTFQDAFLYNPSTGTMTDLGHIIDNDVTTTGLGISIGNTVVGYQQNAGGSQLGWVWTQHAGMHELPWSGLGDFYAYGVNGPGNIVGYGVIFSSGYWHALFWSNPSSAYYDMGTLGGSGDSSYAYGVNDDAWVVGTSYVSGSTYHGFWAQEPGTLLGPFHDIGTIGNASGNSAAYAINGIGQIVGTSIDADGHIHVFLKNQLSSWNTDFQDLGVGYPSFAAINGRGQVVTGNNYIYVPALATTIQPLANFLSSTDRANWTLEDTSGISSDGTVVGWGYHNGAAHAYMIQVK